MIRELFGIEPCRYCKHYWRFKMPLYAGEYSNVCRVTPKRANMFSNSDIYERNNTNPAFPRCVAYEKKKWIFWNNTDYTGMLLI